MIKKYIKETQIEPDVAEYHFRALLLFLSLSSNCGRPCFPSKQLDILWHVFILFTRDYEAFCKTYLKKFVHHTPFVDESDKESSFRPGFFCYIDESGFRHQAVGSLSQLENAYRSDCASAGDCSSCSSCE